MPTFLDGTYNLAALNVPGVYVDVIPPSPNIIGVPTNIEGIVGVGSWGPLNTPIPLSKPADAATKIGTPLIRSHDLATYVWAGTQVGGAIGYYAVRVSDGTDTAASAVIQTNCITLTAKYSGILGNSIIYNVANGTQAGSYMVLLSFPGVNPEQYNNIGLGVGSVTTVAGTTYTSVPSATVTAPPVAANAVQAVVNPTLSVYGVPTVTFGGTSGFVVNDLVTLSNGVVLKVATVSSGVISTVTLQSAGLLTGGAIPANPVSMTSTSGVGVGTPTFTLTWGLGAPTIVTPGQGYLVAPLITLSGGGGTGGSYTALLSIWLNLANAINNGNSTRGPSAIVTASAGVGVAAPTLSTPVTLAGGTDGAAGVTDATLVGQDIIPRKGMYALRSTGIDGFSLCDLSTAPYYPVIDSFSVSENALAVHATVSGDTIANAIATLTSSGLDDFPAWLIVGDWPTFYDSQNQLSRLVNPAAFALGLIGNLSPEQSPINKPLRGISATQKTQSGQTYSDTELSAAELGRVDLIVGPPTTPGGNYYSFITGRNTSSNTAGNGIEYSRMTWFIARSVQSKAAGSIVGRLQSVRPNDKTRSDAKALLDGFFAQLADPAYGSNGNGLIDQWSVQCDLNNNTPATQALGYLFAYCTVRYLNTVRYFVVKLAGGGNVNVTVQSTPPTPAQFS
jgi:hypothetical protein